MSVTAQDTGPIADDGFERHFAEKIWALIPEVYRDADGTADKPDQLRALVEILAGQVAIARRSVDRLWADTRVDEADDWAIPYIAALLGTRLVSEPNRAARRADLGRTIFYRRRAGTPRLMESLADDIADWDTAASEAFKRLFRTWHMLDGDPAPGPLTRSPQWGLPDLRNVRIGDLLDGPHDDLSHLPDFRRHRGFLGRYNIPKANLHLHRQYAFPLSDVTPVELDTGLFTLDPSGRDAPLFQVGGLGTTACVAPREWEVRAPIPCRRLNTAAFLPLKAHAPAGLADLLAPLYGRRFETEAGLLKTAETALSTDPAPPNQLADHEAAQLIAAAMDPDSPRRNLFPGGDDAAMSVGLTVAADIDGDPLGPETLYAANLARWGVDHGLKGWIEALVDPETGRVRVVDPIPTGQDLFVQRIHYGTFWPVGAGTHDRAAGLSTDGFTTVAVDQPDLTGTLSGELRFMDSRTFVPLIGAGDDIEVDGALTLSAVNGTRPYLRLETTGDALIIRALTPGSELILDGLWIGVWPRTGATAAEIRLEGDWARVTLRNTTLDPGGERAAPNGQAPEAIPAVRLHLAGQVEELLVDRCVTGGIEEQASAIDACSADRVTICDGIVLGDGTSTAVHMRNGALCIDRCTVFGALVAGRLDASRVLVDGQVRIADRQTGCFRFSAAAEGSRVPHPYESHFFPGGMPPGTFVSRRFGDPGLAQLTQTAPEALRTGGGNGTEIGAYHRALAPIKHADLQAKLDEFMPVNVIPQLVIET